MKILIITQKVDRNDPVLGFFHRWIEEFAKHCERVTVICLGKGEFNLPTNVKVLSLGKEIGQSKLKYLTNFYRYIWQERNNYDTVFVHMNQEYVLLAGWWWRLWDKRVTMWRNHHAGSWLTDMAAAWCQQVFCTSKFSYTAKYAKTAIMPVGVDTVTFAPASNIARAPQSFLFLSRISPVKKPDVLIEALGLLRRKNIAFTASIYGDALPKDQAYYQSLKRRVAELGLIEVVKFYPGVPNYQTPEIYSAHQIFINLSSSGMYDKTIFEAMACGCLVIASNDNLRGHIAEDFILTTANAEELAAKLEQLLSWPLAKREQAKISLREFVESHSLTRLVQRLLQYF